MNEVSKRSGEGKSPLHVRRRVSIKDRIKIFLDKIEQIDKEYMPQPQLLLSDDVEDRKRYRSERKIWATKLRQTVRTEKKWLKPEGTPEAKGSPKIRMDTFRVRMSMYRKAFYDRFNYINPEFGYQARKLLDSGEISEESKKLLKHVLRLKNNDKATKVLVQGLDKNAEAMSDREYNALRSLRSDLDHPVVKMLSVGERLSKIIKKKAKESFSDRHTVLVHKIKINLYMEWMHRVLDNYEKHDWPNIAIALALATGRRPYEIFVTGKFTKPDGNVIVFSGQAKKHLSDSKPYAIPVLHNAEVCKAAITKLRRLVKLPKNIENTEFNSKTAKTLSERMSDLFQEDRIEFYGLRSAYARYCMKTLYHQSFGTEEAYLASILGHNETDKVTVQHYKTVLFDEEFDLTDAQKHWEKVANEVKKDEVKDQEQSKEVSSLLKKKKTALKYKGAKERVLDFIIDEVSKGNFDLSQSYITREGGFSRPAIKSVLSDISDVFDPEVKAGAPESDFLRV